MIFFGIIKDSQKCDSLGISKIDVSILASIVEEEQDKIQDERPDDSWTIFK